MTAMPAEPRNGALAPADWHEKLSRAVESHRTGALDDAESRYRDVLFERPRQPDALHLLGLIRFQRGDPDEALALIEQAIAIAGDKPDYHFNRGKVLLAAGRLEAAIAAYRQARALDPKNAGILLNLGNAWRRRGDSDEAEDCYRRALALDDDYPLAHNNLATLCRADGRLEEAVRHYRRAAELQPEAASVWENLAKALTDLGHRGEALEAYRRALEIEPGREGARHMVSALAGETTEQAPRRYVRELFDGYAARFETHLVEDLDYRVPTLMRDLLERMPAPPGAGAGRLAAGLDLGCGTGLVGQALRDRVDRLEGVDLSAEMIDRAAAKAVYDKLAEADAVEWLARAEAGSWDLVLAADVLIYLGALDALFREVRRCLAPGGRLLFSVESLDEPAPVTGYQLRPSGRYAHGRGYLEGLAETHGFEILAWDRIALRKDGEKRLTGWLIAYART